MSRHPRNNAPSMLGWLYLETCGRHVVRSPILEISLIITDKYLVELGSKTCVIANTEESLRGIEGWMHKKYSRTSREYPKDLLEESMASTTALKDVEDELLAFAESICGERRRCLIVVGKSANIMLQFLHRRFNALAMTFFSNQVIDLDTLNNVTKLCRPDLIYQRPRPPQVHRAIVNAYHGINLLSFYQQHLFVLLQTYAPQPSPRSHVIYEPHQVYPDTPLYPGQQQQSHPLSCDHVRVRA